MRERALHQHKLRRGSIRQVVLAQGFCQEMAGTWPSAPGGPYIQWMRPAAVRATFVFTVLALTALLAALLTVQAVRADRDHRVSAERVLTDYAALGAGGVTARMQAALSTRFYPVLLAGNSTSLTPVGVAAMRTGATGAAREVASTFTRLARVDTATGEASSAGALLSVTDKSALVDAVRTGARAMPANAYMGMSWVRDGSGMDLVAFVPIRTNPSRGEFVAVTVPFADLAAMINRGISTESVVPASLSHGVSVDSGVQVRVTSGAGELARRGSVAESRFRAARPLGPAYADIGIEVTLGESLAPLLLTGGLPSSRVPLLIAMLVAIIALIVAVGDQLRRERELTRLRDDFVASVSHELRTPLAQIRLFAETLRLARVRTPEEGQRSLAIVENEAKRLEHLVGNLLHFSRSERGAMPITRAATDLSALLGEINAEFTPLAGRAGSAIDFQAEPGVHALVDRAAMRQVLLNLLDNAVKYGRKGQTIALRLATQADGVRIEVENEGDGIPPHERDRIWKRFWRGESARLAGVTGTGIGLAIVSDVVTMHGGTVSVESPVGGGTRIVVRLPGPNA